MYPRDIFMYSAISMYSFIGWYMHIYIGLGLLGRGLVLHKKGGDW